MMRHHHSQLFFVAALALLTTATACSTPTTQTMVDADIIGDRTVKYMLLEPGRTAGEDAAARITGDEDVTEFHFTLRVCDIGDDHQETNCADSTVLRQVAMNPDPEDTSEVDARRSVTSVFWYDARTLYVGYLERPEDSMFDHRPQPRVRMCRVSDDNHLDCFDQAAINELLEVEG